MKVERLTYCVPQKPEISSEQTLSTKEPVSERDISPDKGNTSNTSDYTETTLFSEVDNSLLQPTFGREWEALKFDNAAKFAMFFKGSLVKGIHTLYPWQIDELEKISFAKASAQHPYKYALCACNGSGKDLYFNAIVALYFICCRIRFRFFATSASVRQLIEQTERYIVDMANDINAICTETAGGPILTITQHRIVCHKSGSEIILRVTDEEGKAEGYHPFDGGEMAILVNEAKSVSPEIFRALRRCTGYSYFLLVSSPGEPKGDFHDAYINWPNTRRITIFDCPHHAREEYEDDKRRLGESDAYFRSKWLAAFTGIGGKTILDWDSLRNIRRNVKEGKIKEIFQEHPIRVGIDIALSERGDHSVISAWKGNKHIKLEKFKNQNVNIIVDIIEDNLNRLNIPKNSEYIFADDGGVGRAVNFILIDKGWNIKRIQNQSQAKNTKQYRNRGAELWHKFARLVQAGIPIFIDDDRLYSQLMSRKFVTSTAALDKLCLESKIELKSKGFDSPDEADATVLAFTGINIREWLDAFEFVDDPKPIKSQADQYLEIEKWISENQFPENRRQGKKAHGSLNVIYGRERRNQKLLGNWAA